MKPTQFCKESLLSCLFIILEDSISEEKNLLSRVDNKQQTKLAVGKENWRFAPCSAKNRE